jgi:hypothetical protein
MSVEGGAPEGSCTQLDLNSAALRTPCHGLTACGGRQRRAPTGGCANGIPLKAITPFAAAPRTLPLSICTRVGSAADG